jgi:hypothetical protein
MAFTMFSMMSRKAGVGRMEKSGCTMRWTKQVSVMSIFMVAESLTKTWQRIDVVSATRRITGTNNIDNLVVVGASKRYLLRIACHFLIILSILLSFSFL